MSDLLNSTLLESPDSSVVTSDAEVCLTPSCDSTMATTKDTSSISVPAELTDEQFLTMPPWIPGFCLSINKWGFVLVGDWLQEVAFNTHAIKQLELADEVKTQLQSLVKGMVQLDFTPAPAQQVINGKGRGLNVLLYGEPGVGKTTTAGLLFLLFLLFFCCCLAN
jgi:Cdc6-like AAA superfamily ATPase